MQVISQSPWPYANGNKEKKDGKLVPLSEEELARLREIAIEVATSEHGSSGIFNGAGHYEYITAGKVGVCMFGVVRAQVHYREEMKEVLFIIRKSRSGKKFYYRPI